MIDSTQKLPFREKAGYALGDASANFVFQTMMFFQATFYTDTFGISASAAGTLFLLVRVWDGFFDPMMGVVADRTNTRWGKFRPWILWMAVPFGVMFVLTFTTPDFGPTGKLVYAYITYTLLMMVYSANNLPYSALNGVMTGDVDERTSLSSFRFVAAMGAAFIVQGLTLPLVAKFGHGDNAKGWQMTIGLFSIISIIFFIITFFSAKERILPDPKQKTSVKQDFIDLGRNGAWMIMFVMTLSIFIMLSLRGSTMNYFFNYYVDRAALNSFLDKVGLLSGAAGDASWGKTVLGWFGMLVEKDGSNTPSVAFSFFNMAGNVVTIIAVLFSKSLSMRFGKKTVFIVGLSLTTLITAAFFALPKNAVGSMMVLSLLWPACYGPTIPILWAMIADVADFSEWKTGRRATGMVYAGIVFALKAGLGVGGAIAGWVMSGYGYVANVAQTETSLLGIRLCASIYSAIPLLVGVVCLILYPISTELNHRIQHELEERRSKYAKA